MACCLLLSGSQWKLCTYYLLQNFYCKLYLWMFPCLKRIHIWNFRPTIYTDIIFRDAWIRCKQKFGNVYDLCPIVKQWLQNGKVNLPVSYDEIPIWAGQIVGKIFHLASPTNWLFRWKAVCSYTIAGWLFGWPTESSHSFTVSGIFKNFRTNFAPSHIIQISFFLAPPLPCLHIFISMNPHLLM